MCPICREKRELSKSGVSVLPNNFNWSDLGLEKSSANPGLAGVGLPKSKTWTGGSGVSGELLKCENGMVYLCQECLDSHQKIVATRKHTTQLLDEEAFTRPPRRPTCSIHHGEELNLYCPDFNVALCRECAIFSTHRRHNYESLKDVAAEVNERLPRLRKLLKKPATKGIKS